MAEFPNSQLLNITFQVDPETVNITEDEMVSVQNRISASILEIIQSNNLGELSWFEVGGYAKWSKA